MNDGIRILTQIFTDSLSKELDSVISGNTFKKLTIEAVLYSFKFNLFSNEF